VQCTRFRRLCSLKSGRNSYVSLFFTCAFKLHTMRAPFATAVVDDSSEKAGLTRQLM
jgi:hypothetical protein